MHWSEFRWYDWLFWVFMAISWFSVSHDVTKLQEEVERLRTLLGEKPDWAALVTAREHLQSQVDALKPEPPPPVDGWTAHWLREKP
jgi:hypothetical protein